MRSAETELQNTIELRATVSEIAAPKPGSRRQSRKKTILKRFLKGFLKGELLAAKLRKSADKSLSQPVDAATPIRFTMFSCKRQ